MSDFIATFPWTLPLQRLQQRDPVLAPLALFDADGALNAHGQALEQLLLAGQALAQREADVALVADEL
ncbi:hypothetical protein, partial [Stenotrophomonas pictorum]